MIQIPSQASGLACFDPLLPEIQAEPHRFFDEYRRRDPVHWSGCPDGRRGRWYVFDYRSASTALTDKRFCREPVSSRGACPVAPTGASQTGAPAQEPASCGFNAATRNCLLFQDPPRHTRMRAAVKPLFTLPAAQALRPLIDRRVRELLAPLSKFESFDLMREIASPLPLDVIAEVLGVGFGERAAFHGWSAAFRNGLDRPKWGSDAMARAEEAIRGLREYFEAAWKRHRTQPGKGVLSALFELEGHDAGLTKEEAFGTFTLLISAGHETTTNLVGSGMYLLELHPRERGRLLEQPDLMPRAIEEILRFESPVQLAARNVAEEIELGGRRLLPGQRVEILLGSANRDPAVFNAPDRFDVGRKPNPHLAFGLGIHYCLGASLGRLIASVALPILLERVQVQAFAPGTNPWSRIAGFRGLAHLPARCAASRGRPNSDKGAAPKRAAAQACL
jgi:pimeloyl-[acyl-carrier protein] synthase